jgi:ABC-type nitrate/sulfonate/bicarbonate transport system substrate-binding protein
MKRTWMILAALVAAFAFAAVGCGDDDDDGGNGGEPKHVTFMLDWAPNTNHSGVYLAKAKGWYEEVGLDVSIVEPGAGGVEQIVAAGGAQFGVSIQESVIPARANGVPIVSIAAIVQHNTSSLMSAADDGIQGPGDLAGKTYGGFGGALETALIKQLTECGGGDPESVKFVDVGQAEYLDGLARNQYDFVWIFDAWDGIRATEIEDAPVNFLRFIDYTDCIPDWYTPLIITSESMIKDDPETVRAFMEATSRGYEYAMEHPDEAAQALLDAAPELDEQLVTLSAEYLATRYVDDGRQWGLQDEEIWTRFEQFLRDAGLTDTEVDVSTAYTNEFLPE